MRRLIELRTDLNITQSFIAEKIGVDRSTFAKYESGKHQPSLENLIALAKYFNVTTDYILGLSDQKNTCISDFTDEEICFIKKYRELDSRGKNTVDAIIDREYSFVKKDLLDNKIM